MVTILPWEVRQFKSSQKMGHQSKSALRLFTSHTIQQGGSAKGGHTNYKRQKSGKDALGDT